MENTPLSAAHRRYMRTEICVSSFVNALMTVLVTYLVFRQATMVPLWGSDGIAFDLVVTAFMVTLLGGLGVSLVTRRRVRGGAIGPLDPAAQGRIAQRLPGNLAVRIVLLALCVTAVTVPLALAALNALAITSMALLPLLVFKTVFAVAVGLLWMPLVLKAALADPVSAASLPVPAR